MVGVWKLEPPSSQVRGILRPGVTSGDGTTVWLEPPPPGAHSTLVPSVTSPA